MSVFGTDDDIFPFATSDTDSVHAPITSPTDDVDEWTIGDPPAFTWPPPDHQPTTLTPQLAPQLAPVVNVIPEPSVFGDTETVDGLIYAQTDVSPELQWNQQNITVPLPPTRERPSRPTHDPIEIWKPDIEPDTEPVAIRTVHRAVVSLAPLAIIVFLAILVVMFTKMYSL